MPRRELREGNAAVALTSPCYNAVRSLFVVRRFHPPPPRPPPPRRTPFQHPSSNAEAEAQCFILTGQQQPGVVLVPSRRNYNSCKCPTLHGFRRNPVITSILVKWGRGGGDGGGRRGWGGITRDRRSFCRPRSEFHWTSNFLSHRRSSMRAYIYTFPSLSLPHACVCMCFSLPFFLHFSPFSLPLSLARGFYFFLRVFFFSPLRRYFFLLVAHSFCASLPSPLWTYTRVSMREGHRKPVYTVEYIVAAIRWNVRCAPLWLVTFFLVFFFWYPFWLFFFFFPFLLFFFVKRHGGRMIFIKRIMLFEVSILLRLKVKTIGKSEGIFIR